jgi:hypothetical protein
MRLYGDCEGRRCLLSPDLPPCTIILAPWELIVVVPRSTALACAVASFAHTTNPVTDNVNVIVHLIGLPTGSCGICTPCVCRLRFPACPGPCASSRTRTPGRWRSARGTRRQSCGSCQVSVRVEGGSVASGVITKRVWPDGHQRQHEVGCRPCGISQVHASAPTESP